LTCGKGLHADSGQQRCRDCIAKPPLYGHFNFLLPYEGAWGELLRRAKIGRQMRAIAALRFVLQHKLEKTAMQARYQGYAVLAMPTPLSRLLQRGFNLPQIFARDIARLTALSVVAPSVVRLPFSLPKKAKMNRRQRQQHQLLFRVERGLPEKILLVDDVLTTGASLNQLARALRSKGIVSIDAWALMRVK